MMIITSLFGEQNFRLMDRFLKIDHIYIML